MTIFMTMTSTDKRHSNGSWIFNPELFWEEPIIVIWCWGIGSPAIYYMSQMWCTNITIVDCDEIEEHNVASQFYKQWDVGKLKVDALAENIEMFTWVQVKKINRFITKENPLDFSEYKLVVLAVDNMEARKNIVEMCSDIEWLTVIEWRMWWEVLQIYTFQPFRDMEKWLNFWYSDEEALPDQCTFKSISYNTWCAWSVIASKVARVLKWEDTSFVTNIDMKTMKVTNNNL